MFCSFLVLKDGGKFRKLRVRFRSYEFPTSCECQAS